jgi:hypothetical protein
MGTINSSDRIDATLYCLDIVCLRNICVNTLHKGDSDDDDNNKNIPGKHEMKTLQKRARLGTAHKLREVLT